KITFFGCSIDFNSFTILDSAKNKATIDGGIATKDFRNMKLDLKVNARNWQALNSTAKDNELFYGKLFLTTNLNIKGTPSAPNVDGSINILKETELTVINPDRDPSVVSNEGIV